MCGNKVYKVAFKAKDIVPKSKGGSKLFIYVGGVPAVGKTSIILEVEKMANKQGISLERTIGTDLLCELAGVITVSELRRLPEETRKKLRPEMNRRLYERDRSDPSTIRVCDGHFCFFDSEGKKCGKRQIQPWDKEQMKGFIVVLAKPKIVLARRMKEIIERPDRQCSKKFIENEQQLEVAIAKNQAKEIGIPIEFLVNNNQRISVVAKKIFSLIECWSA